MPMNDQCFHWPVRVYIEDTDAGGIVYYVNYLKFMERARTEFLRSQGFDKQFIFNEDLLFVVHSVKVDYHKPATLDDQLLVSASIIKSGGATMLLEQIIYRDSQSGRELICSGEVKIVCVDKKSFKPKRIPKKILGRIKA
jgi:tol-pal system-associated acyl-CoA thioesterase